MKVILVNGSPHKSGCTNRALQIVASEIEKEKIETEIFEIGTKPIGGCMGCRKCEKTGNCIFDDTVNVFRSKAQSADGFIFGTPVHFGSIAGNMVSFMDRVFYVSVRCKDKLFYLKPAAGIESSRRAGSVSTWDQMNRYFGIMHMPIITSQYWNLVFGANPEQTVQDYEGLQTLRNLGKNMSFFLKCREAGMQTGVQLPEAEEKVYTSFFR